jgi:CBS domain-containing protein
VLTLRRSILTEKVSRRGYHLSREYGVDPLEILFVREVMRTSLVVLHASLPLRDVAGALRHDRDGRAPRLYPVVDAGGRLAGVVTRARLLAVSEAAGRADMVLGDQIDGDPAVAYPDEPLRVVVNRMAETGLTRFPVVDRAERRLLGMISLSDLLQARVRNLDAERRRERVLPLHALVPWATRRVSDGAGRPEGLPRAPS